MKRGAFQRLVEVGRVIYINHGKYYGKLAVIVEIVDQNRALVDGPTTGVPRHVLSFKRMILTKFTVKNVFRGCRNSTLRKALEKDDFVERWNKTGWAQKIKNREQKASMNDFDRFKVAKLKKRRRMIVGPHVKALAKQQSTQ